MSKGRNVPPSSSALAGPPKLVPKVNPLRVGDGAQAEEGWGPEEEHDRGPEPQGSRRAPAPGRTRGGRRPPPAAADAIPTTVRFDPDESADIDRFILVLRDDARRRSLDKAEVFRELIRLAREHEPTRRALLRRLR